jgi:hypothetical protein
MPYLEQAYKWTFTSTGTGKFIPLNASGSVTFGFETSSGCTATAQVLHRMGSTSGKNGVLSTVAGMAADALNTDQFLGPLEYVAPRISDKTAGSTNTVTVYLRSV